MKCMCQMSPEYRNSTGSDGRGVIGVLETNIVEPAHDKQGFERTIVLSRLETCLIQMQNTYWLSERRAQSCYQMSCVSTYMIYPRSS
ncbi:putative morc, S5 domain 2 protein [Helianthus anomalus]